MAAATTVRAVRDHPRATTSVISAVGYALVVSAFTGLLPLPEVSTSVVNRLADLIAVTNSLALAAIVIGYREIRRRRVGRHRAAMLTAFGLIMVFLAMYVLKVGGGFEKAIVIQPHHPLGDFATTIRFAYLGMLAIHIFLSVVSVPLVVHAVVLGLTRHPSELANTIHPRVGRLAVAAWSVSLALGVITYFLLNHVYAWEPVIRGGMTLLS